MKKSDRISRFVKDLAPNIGCDGNPNPEFDPRYVGFFICFNRGEYYEAHDVLENLWLETTDGDYPFYKGLIQIAGAFVHLKKQHARPTHPKDGRRLHPALRLFILGMKNLTPFLPKHHGLEITELVRVCEKHVNAIRDSRFEINPWQPHGGPIFTLKPR